MAGSDYGMSPMDGMSPGAFADDDTVRMSSIARTEPFSTMGGLPSDTTITGGGNGIQNDIVVGPRNDGNDRRNGRQTSELPTRSSTGGMGFGGDLDQLDLLGRDVKRMMDTISRLRMLGFETSVVSLPKIVVIGDQSTGKSSVIEAISDIKVPRSVGTCTRCPLEVNLTHSDKPWSCKVYLSRKFAYNPSILQITKENRFGPWDEMDTPDVVEFAETHDKSKVAEALKWAQTAILNPSYNYKLYRPGNNRQMQADTIAIEFSPNVVRVDISGPGIPNLCFYDLPGLISHVGDDGSQYLVKLVDNLAKDYMKAEDTLILLTLTMNHDIQNSKAAGMMQRYKADDRTLGVFTKPDLLSPEAKDQFIELFAGEKFKRKLGYYAVKNNPDPLVGHTVARQEERSFFRQWVSKYPLLGKYKHRFGTELLTKELSKQLVQRITQSLPKIREIVHQKVEALEDELEALPKPPTGNFSLEVANSLGNLSQNIKALFNPDAEDFDFYQRWSKINDGFCASLTGTHPQLDLASDNDNSLEATSRSPGPRPARRSQEVIDLDDDDNTVAGSATPAPPRSRKRRPEEAAASTNKRQRTDASGKPVQRGRKAWTLHQVRDLIRRKNDTGLRGLDNPRVTKDIFSQSIGHWELHLDNYISKTNVACGKAVMDNVRTAFQKQRDTQLYETIQKVARAFLKESFKDHHAFAKRCLNMEKIMFTLNPVASGQIKNQVLRDLREERCEERVKQEIGDEVLTEQQYAKKMAAAKKEMEQTPDEYDAEIQQMATVRGYYDYAATRLAEYTALSFRGEIFTKIRDHLCAHLTKELRLEHEDANKYLGGLLEMDPSVATKRAGCEQELQRLSEGLQQLDDLERGASDSSGFDDASTQSTVL